MARETNVRDPDAAGHDFYRNALRTLLQAGVPFLVGGAYALEWHTGIVRRTKDFDIFVLPSDVERVLALLSGAGYRTEITFAHWLGKAYCGDYLIDIIFNSGNGVCPVDEKWFEHAPEGEVLGLRVKLCPVEETIWQKAFILERDRCDAADVAHLLQACAERLDWQRLVWRFGSRWRILLAHLVLFGFVYPARQSTVPQWVIQELTGRLIRDTGIEVDERLCQGTLLSATQYREDLAEGYEDARLIPHGGMTQEEILHWSSNFETK